MFRPSKRQRKDQSHPTCWLDYPTLDAVIVEASSSSSGSSAVVASPHVENLFLERFEQEMVKQCSFTASRSEETNNEFKRQLLKQRIVVGTNACTRVLQLEKSTSSLPLLVVLVTQPTAKTTCLPWVHIPIVTHQRGIPLLRLSEAASTRLSRLLRARHVSVLAFLPAKNDTSRSKCSSNTTNKSDDQNSSDAEKELHAAVDSFVDFILKKTSQQP